MPPKEETRWVEISTEADRQSVDDLVGLLGSYCVGGAVVEEKPDHADSGASKHVTVKGFLPVWDKDTLRKLEIALLLLGRVSPISEPRISILEPEDWAESWKAFFSPQRIGDHTLVVPTWREHAPQPDAVVIRLDPGMAFGTGLHITTRLCLVAIERLLRPGMRVLDVGTGSGILAISAALQEAERVDAIDIDPVAVQVARENVLLNNASETVRVKRATLASSHRPDAVPLHRGGAYDLLLVNILAETIIDMAPAIARAVATGGTVVASGIICERAEEVASKLEEVGLGVDERLQENGWTALICHRV